MMGKTARRSRSVATPARRSRAHALVAIGSLVCALVGAAPVATAAGSWSWPVVGPVLRGFDRPDTPWGSGHRGIDIACARGTAILAPASGTVTFAGSVGGQRYVTVDHGGLQSTASWVASLLVRKGDVVTAGTSIATCGDGHTGSVIPHVHFGVRDLAGTYLDPMGLLSPPRVTTFIRLVSHR